MRRGALGALGTLFAFALVLACPVPANAQSAQEIEAALDLYRYRLLQSTTRLRSYPQQALDDQLEGDCAIELVIAGNGTLKSATLLVSTGHAVLDEHAIMLIHRAAPLTEIPSTLQNKAFAVRFAIAFRLPD